ncbi:hypothetical protein J6590_076182 [Homalodisca vitripennis]|nr:hypothetical protein J6590_076182 [Homalodisca vitripennis]
MPNPHSIYRVPSRDYRTIDGNSCRQERALITESDDSEGDGGVSVNYCIEGEGGTLPETPSVIRYT